jgi:Fe-S-cluster containining protein
MTPIIPITNSEPMKEPEIPWYKDGLRFGCIGCAGCCRTHGRDDEYAFVYLNSKDVDAVAAHLGLERIDFLNEHCINNQDGWVHLSSVKGDCSLLDGEGRCRIYSVRPKQCDTWPFWTENLDKALWYGSVKDCCPGIGCGRLYSAKEIEKIAADRNAWHNNRK